MYVFKLSCPIYSRNEPVVYAPVSSRQSVHGMPLVVRALGGVEPEGTHLERRKKLETSSQERYTSADIWPFCVQAQAAEDVLEWLQPSGRRPEGCCCSTELSGGRGQVLGVAGYYTRPIMHAPHTLRLTLANIQCRTVCHGAHSKGIHLMMRAGRRQKPIPLPSVHQVKPYLLVLSTFSTAGMTKPLPSCTLHHVL